VSEDRRVENLLRELAPQVLGALVRRHGRLDECEDAVQEALIQAHREWSRRVPEHPRGWLLTVATRRLIDQVRSDVARRSREDHLVVGSVPAELARLPGEDSPIDRDDTLILLYLCCHPSVSSASQLALTLRAVGGLSTREIASAFFVPESTMAQRISRAKQTIREAGARFVLPPANQVEARTRVVLHVLYLIFNEGYTATSGAQANRPDLTVEAIRLTRHLRALRPNDSETDGLLALMLLTEARRPARLTPDGDLIPLAEQDRTRWTHTLIGEGVALVTGALARGPLGPYQLQAAIAAVHDEAASAVETDWRQVLALYETLDRIAPNPMATVNRVVAVAMVHGPLPALALLALLDDDQRIHDHHLTHAVRGHLLDLAGQPNEAATAFDSAARRTASEPERRYLHNRARDLRVKPTP
jgi:RNA polymerase sigma factor (sigma-70 family)